MGTTIELYLPRLVGDLETIVVDQRSEEVVGGQRETILLVEDNDEMRAHIKDVLSELGYVVLDAPRGEVAMEVLDQRPDVKLLFTDIGLPGGISGRELAALARTHRPGLRVLFMSGYARDALTSSRDQEPGTALLSKPFTFAELGNRIVNAWTGLSTRRTKVMGGRLPLADSRRLLTCDVVGPRTASSAKLVAAVWDPAPHGRGVLLACDRRTRALFECPSFVGSSQRAARESVHGSALVRDALGPPLRWR